MNRYIFLDVETTGLSPQKGDRIIEIGCVEVINSFITGRIFHSYFNTKAKINEDAYNIHGISKKFLLDKPIFNEKMDDFLGFIDKSIIIAHNAKFDINFIYYEINECGGDGLNFRNSFKFIDSLEFARKMFPNKRNDLNSLCKRYKLNISKIREKHNALIDAWLLSIIVMKMGFLKNK